MSVGCFSLPCRGGVLAGGSPRLNGPWSLPLPPPPARSTPPLQSSPHNPPFAHPINWRWGRRHLTPRHRSQPTLPTVNDPMSSKSPPFPLSPPPHPRSTPPRAWHPLRHGNREEDKGGRGGGEESKRVDVHPPVTPPVPAPRRGAHMTLGRPQTRAVSNRCGNRQPAKGTSNPRCHPLLPPWRQRRRRRAATATFRPPASC